MAKFFGNELPVKLEIASGAGEWAAAQDIPLPLSSIPLPLPLFLSPPPPRLTF